MKFKSPTGAEIIGTLECLQGCALVQSFNPDGTVEEYEGETKVYWDTQVTLNVDDHYVDDDGAQWTFKDLTPITEEEDSEALWSYLDGRDENEVCSDLDDLVHYAASSMASNVNNQGRNKQIDFLLTTSGWTEEEILNELKAKEVPDAN